jgi:hypothetical protein
MSRKILYTGKILINSQWYRDLARGKASSWVNEVTSNWRYSGRRIVYSSIRSSLDSFEVQIRLQSQISLSILVRYVTFSV